MNLTSLLVYITVMSFTPGPSNLMCLYLGAKGGMRHAAPFMCGSMTGLFVKSIICGLLNLVLAEKIPVLVPYLKWIGFAYMLYLACAMVIGALRKGEDASLSSGEGSFISGIMLQVVNVKSWIASLSIFSVYVTPYTEAVSAILLVSFVFMLIAALASVLWCGCGTAIHGIYKRYRLPLSCALAAALVYCALSAVK